ncbi:MAG: MFS transporter [Caldisericaceae bacterium]|nr:MFS transporter [Caldisericaceae bacterium]
MNYIGGFKKIGRNVKLFLLSNILTSVGLGAFFVIFNIYLKEIGLRGPIIGKINGAMSLGMALFAYFSGIISDRIGRRKALFFSIALNSFFFLVLSFSKVTGIIGLSSFGLGVAGSLFTVSEQPFVMENTENEERTHAFSLSMATLFLGEFIGSLVGGFLPEVLGKGAAGMQRSFFVIFLLVLSGTIPVFMIKEKYAVRSEIPISKSLFLPFETLAKHKDKISVIAIFVISQFLIGFGAGLVIPFFNLYFKERFSLSTGKIGIIFSLGAIIIMLGTLLSPIVRHFFGKLRGFLVIQILSLPFVLLLAFTKKLWVAIVSYLARATLMNSAVPIETQLYIESVPEESRASMSSFMQIAWNASWAIAAPVAGVIMQKRGFTALFLMMFCFYVAGISVLYFALRGRINE